LTFRHTVWGCALVAGLLAILSLTVMFGDYDIVAMMRKIHQNTTEIGDVNGSILTSLGTVGQQFEQVEAIQARLLAMESLIDQQIDELELVTAQTAHQAELSLELQRLTEKMVAPVNGLAQTATTEAELLDRTSARAAHLSLSLRAIATINRTIAEKLRRAEQLAALVLSRMP